MEISTGEKQSQGKDEKQKHCFVNQFATIQQTQSAHHKLFGID